MSKQQPLVAHLIYCFDTGGLERVMLNCIRQMSGQGFRHLVISLTHATEFANQLPPDVAVYCLHKKPGADLGTHWRLLQLLRETKPDILHSYNLATLEYHPVAWLAGVRGHLHAEHGRDISDPNGENKKYQWLRRLISPFLHSYVAVSGDLHRWLAEVVGIKASKNRLIYNGINLERFVPQSSKTEPFTFIHVARLATVKDQRTLLDAIALLKSLTNEPFQCWIVGDGPERDRLQRHATELGLEAPFVQWLGERNDIAQLMAQSQVFVLSSIAEGIPMTVLEAMACGLAVVATDVGGLPELIAPAQGQLVPSRNPQAMATAMQSMLQNPAATTEAGTRCRERVCRQFSEQAMVAQYLALYREFNQ